MLEWSHPSDTRGRLMQEHWGIPLVESSSSVCSFAGQSIFSAPSCLRTFFHKTLASIEEGRPESTIVRMARGSFGTLTTPLGFFNFPALAGLAAWSTFPDAEALSLSLCLVSASWARMLRPSIVRPSADILSRASWTSSLMAKET